MVGVMYYEVSFVEDSDKLEEMVAAVQNEVMQLEVQRGAETGGWTVFEHCCSADPSISGWFKNHGHAYCRSGLP
jgi:hypothetical protein